MENPQQTQSQAPTSLQAQNQLFSRANSAGGNRGKIDVAPGPRSL